MDVAVEEGVVRASFWDFEPQDFDRFIDARVRLRGNVGSLFGRTEQLRGVSLFVGHTGDIVVLEPPPDPVRAGDAADRAASTTTPPPAKSTAGSASAASSPATSRAIPSRSATSPPPPRSATSATCSTSTTGPAARAIETEQAQRVEPGTVVDVAGFPAVTPGKPILTNAVFRVAGHGAAAGGRSP